MQVIPTILYGALSAAIVVIDISVRPPPGYWARSVDGGALELLFGHQPWALLLDLLATTILECASIWIFTAKIMRLHLRNGVVFGLSGHFDAAECPLCLQCTFQVLRTGAIPNSSPCALCVRRCYSLTMFTMMGVMAFFVPMALVLCVFVPEQQLRAATSVDVTVFKAGYGGMMAFTLSPIAALLAMVSDALNTRT